MSKKTKRFISNVLMVVSIAAIIFSLYKLFEIKQVNDEATNVNKEINEIIGKTQDDAIEFLTKETFNELYNINNEFLGYLYYPSLNINEPVVQTDNNEYYLDHSIYKKYMLYGTVFMDTYQHKDDLNRTLYGHWIQNSTRKFSNLHKLINPSNYEKHKTFHYADDEFIYEYEVAIVINHNSVSDYDNIPYWQSNFTEDEFNDFIGNAKKQALYDTQVDVSYSDKLMTLQTCITYDSDERLVIIGKEISRVPIEDQ